jgi:1-phosphofructokinase family hexose kinase
MIYTVTLNPALDREYIVPKLSTNSVLRSSSIQIDYGGKGFNVSRMLASLGTASIAIGFVGGATGETLRDGLEGMGIRTDFVEVSGETRTNVSVVSSDDEQYIKVNEPGPSISQEETNKLISKIRSLVQPGDWWVISGSLPPGIKTNMYTQIISLINAGGAKAVLDTSGIPLKLGCSAGPFLIKPNIEEAAQVTGLKSDAHANPNKMIEVMHNLGVINIILSAGKERSILSNGERQWVGTPPKIKEKNPTGAGDAMLAAVVYMLEKGDSILNAFIWGIASGSAAASQSGTGMASRSAVEKLLQKVIIYEE